MRSLRKDRDEKVNFVLAVLFGCTYNRDLCAIKLLSFESGYYLQALICYSLFVLDVIVSIVFFERNVCVNGIFVNGLLCSAVIAGVECDTPGRWRGLSSRFYFFPVPLCAQGGRRSCRNNLTGCSPHSVRCSIKKLNYLATPYCRCALLSYRLFQLMTYLDAAV